MTDRFGTFVVFRHDTLKKELTPICIEQTEADARGEAHEIAMSCKGLPGRDGVEIDYREIPLIVKGLAHLHKSGRDIRLQYMRLSEEHRLAWDLYREAIDLPESAQDDSSKIAKWVDDVPCGPSWREMGEATEK